MRRYGVKVKYCDSLNDDDLALFEVPDTITPREFRNQLDDILDDYNQKAAESDEDVDLYNLGIEILDEAADKMGGNWRFVSINHEIEVGGACYDYARVLLGWHCLEQIINGVMPEAINDMRALLNMLQIDALPQPARGLAESLKKRLNETAVL